MSDLNDIIAQLPALPIALILAKVLTDAVTLAFPALPGAWRSGVALLTAMLGTFLLFAISDPAWSVATIAETILTGLLAWAGAVGVTELHGAAVVKRAQAKIEAGNQ